MNARMIKVDPFKGSESILGNYSTVFANLFNLIWITVWKVNGNNNLSGNSFVDYSLKIWHKSNSKRWFAEEMISNKNEKLSKLVSSIVKFESQASFKMRFANKSSTIIFVVTFRLLLIKVQYAS